MAHWRLPTDHSEVYVAISRVPLDRTEPHNYDDLSQLVEDDPQPGG